jgi:GTP pyrophosphokinase
LAISALRFARRVHLGQYRKQTGEQFVEHPIAVAQLLSNSGYDGPLIAAAYLHDVVEKTDVELDEIRERFGPSVADLVDHLSEDPEIHGYGERKRALRKGILDSGRDSVVIYAADRVANMRDWRKVEPEARPACGERLGTTLDERLELWTEDAEELHDLDPETPFLSQIETELAALKADARPQ